MAPSSDAQAGARLDIRALLALAMDERPPENLPERVMARLALLTTTLEFGRMFGAALEGMAEAVRPTEKDQDDHD